MILRKPYAFFIRHFKLIHGIIFLCMGYLLYITSNIGSLYSRVVEVKSIVGESNLPDLFNKYMFIAIFVALLLTITIIILLIKKGYKAWYYIINVALLVFMLIFYILAYGNIGEMQKIPGEARTYMAFNDVSTILIYVQGLFTFLWMLKATGFDIKTFSFGQKIVDFDSTDEDSEEFEFSLEIDSNEINTKRKGRTRELKYYYLENRLKINLSIFLILTAITVLIVTNINGNKEIIYKQGTELSTINYSLKIKETYVTNLNYKLEKKYNNKHFVILMVDLKKNKETEYILENQSINIEINGEKYYSTAGYSEDFLDFGNNYNKQKLATEYVSYYFIYEVPYEFSTDEVYAQVINYYNYTTKEYNSYKIKLDYIKINYENIYNNFKLNDDMPINNYGIHTSIQITSADFQEKYKINYKYINNNKEYNAVEYVTPIASDNEEKAIMKLELKQTFVTGERQYKFYNLIKEFGMIEYEIAEQKKTSKIYSLITPKNVKDDEVYYIEVSKEVLKAQKVDLKIKIREQVFIYSLEDKNEENI